MELNQFQKLLPPENCEDQIKPPELETAITLTDRIESKNCKFDSKIWRNQLGALCI